MQRVLSGNVDPHLDRRSIHAVCAPARGEQLAGERDREDAHGVVTPLQIPVEQFELEHVVVRVVVELEAELLEPLRVRRRVHHVRLVHQVLEAHDAVGIALPFPPVHLIQPFSFRDVHAQLPPGVGWIRGDDALEAGVAAPGVAVQEQLLQRFALADVEGEPLEEVAGDVQHPQLVHNPEDGAALRDYWRELLEVVPREVQHLEPGEVADLDGDGAEAVVVCVERLEHLQPLDARG
mmetsp:Transcript_38003/g.89824  ORF Transcript_38003/g.89824 Transcript_38003/m.89824 type:complete len:236 (-) Transcript_38003:1372-2079(-)